MQKKLCRINEGKIIGGVCQGFAVNNQMDVTAVRIIMAILCVLGSLGVWIYIIAWALLPVVDTIAEAENPNLR